MTKLYRPIEIKFRVTPEEKDSILTNMKLCNISNMALYLRTIATRGCIINPDYTQIKQNNYELHKIGVNINQIAKKVNETGNFYAEDLRMLQEYMENIWQLQKSILSEEPLTGPSDT